MTTLALHNRGHGIVEAHRALEQGSQVTVASCRYWNDEKFEIN